LLAIFADSGKTRAAVLLEHALGFVGEQHGVAVEGNPDFVRVLARHFRRFGQDARGRESRGQRVAHVVLIRGQKQRGVQRLQIGEWRASTCKDTALDGEPMFPARVKRAQSADRIAARKDHHFDAMAAGVQCQ
jgi:hypothetical protein